MSMLAPITDKGVLVRATPDAVAEILARPSIRRATPVPIAGDLATVLAWLDPLVRNLSRYRELVLATTCEGWCAVFDNKIGIASNASRLAQVLATCAIAFAPTGLDLYDGSEHRRADVRHLDELGLHPGDDDFFDLATAPLGIEVMWTTDEPDLVSAAELRPRAPARRRRR